MLPNLRSVIAQCYNRRGGRSIGSRRNFCSTPASNEMDPLLWWFISRGIGTAVGYTIGACFFSRFMPYTEKNMEERLRLHREYLGLLERIYHSES